MPRTPPSSSPPSISLDYPAMAVSRLHTNPEIPRQRVSGLTLPSFNPHDPDNDSDASSDWLTEPPSPFSLTSSLRALSPLSDSASIWAELEQEGVTDTPAHVEVCERSVQECISAPSCIKLETSALICERCGSLVVLHPSFRNTDLYLLSIPMAPTTRTQSHLTPTTAPATTAPPNVLQTTQVVDPSAATQPSEKKRRGRPPKRKADDGDTTSGAVLQPASAANSGSKRKKTQAALSTMTVGSGDASHSPYAPVTPVPTPTVAHLPITLNAHLPTAPNAQPLQPSPISTQVPDSIIDPPLLAFPPVVDPPLLTFPPIAHPQPQPSASPATHPTPDQPSAPVGSAPIQSSFFIPPPASASALSASNQPQVHVIGGGSIPSATTSEVTAAGPSTRHRAQRALSLQEALQRIEELQVENQQLEADLRVTKKYKVLYSKEVVQKGKVDLTITGNLIPRPPGEKGKNGWNLQEVLGLKDDFAGYNELLRTVRHAISRSGLNWEATYSEQDAARLGACFKEIKKTHPFLERFVGDWPAKEMVINALQNRRKSLNAKARGPKAKADESQAGGHGQSAHDGVQASGDSNTE